jgi:mono/diheme cytochrome c family protein
MPIFLSSCSSCHGGRNPSDGVDLSSAAAAWADLVNVVSGCRGLALVVPGNPDASYLLAKLTGGNICGGRMPSGSFSPLTGAQIDTIRGWIAAGARND